MQAIQSRYCHLRNSGVDAKAALAQLRPEIVRLEVGQREKLLEQLRVWEISRATGDLGSGKAAKPAPPVAKIKPLQATTRPPAAAQPGMTPVAPRAPQVACPHCGKGNRATDVFCYACGQLLTMERGLFDTRHFMDETDGFHSDEYFGPDTLLVLVIRETQETFSIRPQERQHEVIIGRGAGGTMKPDIDLTPQRAAALGVSRLHLSLSYNEKRCTLSVSDMGSANGTFINGNRLHPEEVRVLRHGDELRLGKLVLVAHFYQQHDRNRQKPRA